MRKKLFSFDMNANVKTEVKGGVLKMCVIHMFTDIIIQSPMYKCML